MPALRSAVELEGNWELCLLHGEGIWGDYGVSPVTAMSTTASEYAGR